MGLLACAFCVNTRDLLPDAFKQRLAFRPGSVTFDEGMHFAQLRWAQPRTAATAGMERESMVEKNHDLLPLFSRGALWRLEVETHVSHRLGALRASAFARLLGGTKMLRQILRIDLPEHFPARKTRVVFFVRAVQRISAHDHSACRSIVQRGSGSTSALPTGLRGSLPPCSTLARLSHSTVCRLPQLSLERRPSAASFGVTTV